MARKRQNKKGPSGLRSKLERYEKQEKEVKLNPFDLRTNHKRHSVLGRKSKHERGMPGLSQNKAIKKRKEIMLKRQLLANKSNYFIDRRIGEYDHTALKEDQIVARLTYERHKKHKTNIYNLNDDEELTHLGKPINEFTKFDDTLDDSDDDDDDKLDANFVKEAHFGGFLVKKSANQDPPKTHKELINELIVGSKRKKQERKMEREENEVLTEKLDKEWKEVHSQISGFKIKEQEDTSKHDEYDMIVNELKFEPRGGTPSSRLKTPEELAKEEKKKLEKLEQERLLRMQCPTVTTHINDRFLSADSIYDGLDIDKEIVEPVNDVSDDFFKNPESESGACSDSENESVDNYSDLNSSSEEDELTNEELCEKKNLPVSSEFKDLPNTFICPSNIDEFLSLASNRTAEEQSEIVARIIKCNHPSLGEGNREKLDVFFKILLEYCDHMSSQSISNVYKIIDPLVPHIYSLAQFSNFNTACIFRNVLLEKRTHHKKQRSNALLKMRIPSSDTLAILKLCGIVYSTSDFRHPVVTIAMLFMSLILTENFFITYYNVVSRLFLTKLFCEWVSESKRFVPESLYILRVVLFMASIEKGEELKRFKGDKNLLVVTSSVTSEPQKVSLADFDDSSLEITDSLKVDVIHSAVDQLIRYAELYTYLPSFPELFSSIYTLCEKLPVGYYPSTLVDSIKKLQSLTKPGTIKRSYLTFPMKKPKPLKLFEPEYEINFTGSKQNAAKKIKVEKVLLKKCKREEKGIMREIRRDSQFVARQKLQNQMEKDEERKNKVKRIYQELSMQEGEYRALTKGKK